MSCVNNDINIIAIFVTKKQNVPKYINIVFCVVEQRCTIVSITSYVHDTCKLFLSQNNASSFPNTTILIR